MAYTKPFFNHEFPNGNRIEVSEKGFVLWDTMQGRWVIDGSTLIDDNNFRVSSDIQPSLAPVEDMNPVFESKYREEKESKTDATN